MSIGRIIAVVVLILEILVGIAGLPLPQWALVATLAAAVVVG